MYMYTHVHVCRITVHVCRINVHVCRITVGSAYGVTGLVHCCVTLRYSLTSWKRLIVSLTSRYCAPHTSTRIVM